jgi:hypothetical protein
MEFGILYDTVAICPEWRSTLRHRSQFEQPSLIEIADKLQKSHYRFGADPKGWWWNKFETNGAWNEGGSPYETIKDCITAAHAHYLANQPKKPTTQVGATPDKFTPVGTWCEGWDDNRVKVVQGQFAAIGGKATLLICDGRLCLRTHARIIETPSAQTDKN